MKKRCGESTNSKLVLGLMSGTSADGIDIALVRICGKSLSAGNASLEGYVSIPYSKSVRAAFLRLADGGATTTGEVSQLNFRIGELFANAALAACRRFGVSPRQIALIGSHGQTIYHQGGISNFLGARVASTLQIGEPAIIAERTGITTVGDFRVADMAAGGQGAPLVPYVDYLLFRHPREGRVALNIGGIANLTVIPASASPKKVFAFDTGPGNMIIDSLVRHFTRGRQTFDKNAAIARRGRMLPKLLNSLLADFYFRQPPPKTAGREQYGVPFAQKLIVWGKKNHAKPEDLIRTATIFTAASILDAMHRWVLPEVRVDELIVSGGGAHNPLIVAQLSAGLAGIAIRTSGELGVPEDAKEAFAFALLAWETVHGRPANIPSATGARHPAILGKICLV